MRLRTKGYLLIIAIVIVLELLMIRLYVQAANEFSPYQLYDLLNFKRDNDFEGGLAFLFIAIILQCLLAIYLFIQDRRTITH